MKIKIFFLLCLLLAACENDVDKQPFLRLSSALLEYGWNGGVEEIVIESNAKWNAVPSQSVWLMAEKKSETCLSISVGENETSGIRSSEIIITTSLLSDTVHIVQKAKERLVFVGEKLILLDSYESTFTVEVDKNVNYKIRYLNGGDEWLSQPFQLSGLSLNKIRFNADENTSLTDRHSSIIIENEFYQLSDTLRVYQKGSEKRYVDGDVYPLSEIKPENVNLIFMGDGFTKKDLGKDGRYEQIILDAKEHFFSIEPYKSYQEYFNTYMVIAESPNEGVGEKNTLGISTFKNKFGTAFGTGTEIICDDELVFEYAQKIKELPKDKPLTVIVVLNSTKYAGTAYLYGNGNSIALCPMSAEEPPNDFEGVVRHEAGGHGFGFLCDEYVYYEKEMPDSRKKDIQEWQKYGYQMNLDFTDDASKILWKDFIGVEKYQAVGAYEGGYEYQYGVWRCEENSCMNNNIPYFNVQSRWSIVKRIMELSEKDFSIQEFIEADNVTAPEVDSRSVNARSFKPLGEPKWIKAK